MLFDPKWEVQTKPDVLSLESLIAWLEKQPADGSYDYCDGFNCVIGQYLKSNGVADCFIEPSDLRRMGWKHIAQDLSGSPQRWTFGAALTRARAALR